MLVRTLYTYDTEFDGALKFKPNEVFLKIHNENEHWLLVSKADGTVGCVPSIYVEPTEIQNENTIKKWAAKTLATLKNGSGQLKNRDIVYKILTDLSAQQSENVYTNRPKNTASPAPYKKSAAPGIPTSLKKPATPEVLVEPLSNKPEQPTESIIPPPQAPTTLSTPKICVPGGLASQLVDILRLGTNASYSNCRDTLRVFLEILASGVPELRAYSDVLEVMLTESTFDQRISSYLQSPDWYLLERCYGALEKCEADSQEGSWKLHEDVVQLQNNLDELVQLLIKSNRELIVHFLKSSDYKPLQSLIRLYQGESRPEIRRKLLLAIGHSCTVDFTCMEVALSSSLPLEMLRELGSLNAQSGISHVSTSLRLLTVLFATSSHLPLDLQSQLNPAFFTKILKMIGPVDSATDNDLIDLDSSRDSSSQEVLFGGQLACAAACFLVACNWHFCSLAAKRNQSTLVPLLLALKANPLASQRFVELIVHAFNRGFDPIFIVEFASKANINQMDRLFRWAELISSCPSLDTENGLDPSHRAAFQSLFSTDHEGASVLPDVDDGLYARSLWSTDTSAARAQLKSQFTVSLPSSVSVTTPRHSVLKLIFDLFSSSDAANLVYDSDQDAIIEVICRELRNLGGGDHTHLYEYPVLLGLIIANSNYISRGAHRASELIESLEVLLGEDHLAPSSTSPSASQRSLDLARLTLNRLQSSLKS